MIGKHLARRGYQTQLLINGRFEQATNNKTFDTFNPTTEEKITAVSSATKADVDKAIGAAREAFDNGPWRRMSGYERGNLMYKLADLMEKNRDELAALESLDNGKPVAIANAADVQLSIDCIRYYAGWADKIHGDVIPAHGPFHAYTRKEPVGVAGQIIPWNFPLLMQAWKLGPALSAGCTVVMKPAELTSLSALRVGELICEAGFPNGVVNLVPGLGAEAGEAITASPLVDKVAFTGSTAVGMHIMRTAHSDNLKRITLELGGKSANIIMDDADIDAAVAQSQLGLFFN
jgi:aldehyde dehydrogenase (NAD+)